MSGDAPHSGLKNGNPSGPRFGPDWPGKRCGAKLRNKDMFCRCPAMANGRCRLHGGKSTGPTTPEGRVRHRRAATKHGVYAGPNHPDYPDGKPGPRWPGLRGIRRQARESMKELGWKQPSRPAATEQPRDGESGRFVTAGEASEQVEKWASGIREP